MIDLDRDQFDVLQRLRALPPHLRRLEYARWHAAGKPGAFGVIDARTQVAIDAGQPEWAGLPATRAEAKALGATRYFSGKPCVRGHVDVRLTSIGTCVACGRERGQDEEYKAKQRDYARERYQDPKVKAKQRDYERERFQDLEKRAMVNANQSKRYAAKKRATWPHMTPLMHEQISMAYAWAQRLMEWTGVAWHVDHIVPLQHSKVQGYHVPWNMQVLTQRENASKNNSFDGTMNNEGWRARLIDV